MLEISREPFRPKLSVPILKISLLAAQCTVKVGFVSPVMCRRFLMNPLNLIALCLIAAGFGLTPRQDAMTFRW